MASSSTRRRSPSPHQKWTKGVRRKLKDMTTAAHDAVVSVGVPESAIQTYKDVLEERRIKAEQT